MIKVVKCFSIFVLIDTWWNVNTNKLGAGVEEVSVLIDTWWNVNVFILYIITRRK